MRLRGGWPTPVFVLAFVALPIFEVWLLIQVGHALGWLPTVLLLLVEALLGGWLLRREGRRSWQALTAAFGGGRAPTSQLADAALVLLGGVLLILPGFATDVVGLFFLLPWTRPLARRVLGLFLSRRLAATGAKASPGDDLVIEGEVVTERGDDASYDGSAPQLSRADPDTDSRVR